MRILLILLVCTLSFTFKLEAQQKHVDPLMESYQNGLQEFKSSSYTKAYTTFVSLEDRIEDKQSLLAINTRYYISKSAMHLYHNDAVSLMESFVREYPNSSWYFEALRNLADYYYDKRDYQNAADYYSKIDETSLRRKFRSKYKFQYAYSLFFTGEFQVAASLFHELLTKDSDFIISSKYYFGYIAYINGNYATAKKYFLELLKNGYYNDELPLYIAQIYHEQTEYDSLLVFAQPYLDSLSDKTPNLEFNALLAEAHFHLKDYENAIYFFEDKYLEKGGELDDAGYYILGQSYYRSEEYSLASSAFNKIVAAEDSLAQNAYYYLADCYIELGDKRSAQNAFESASLYDFNNAITEHSNFNFAKLCYELGYPYADPTMILQDFINDYPDSEYVNEVYTYLVNAFLTHKDYSRAIKSMETSGLENIRLQQAYQEVSYYRAVQLFNDMDYQNAIIHFDKSLIYTHNSTYNTLAQYWKGESFYRMERYEESIAAYREFQNTALNSSMPEFVSASYHIAYAYFKIWDFPQAIQAFETFVGNVEKEDVRLHDAYIRMADSHYMLKDFVHAILNYQKAIETWGVDSDYAAYQIALAHYQTEKHEQVISHLSSFANEFPTSTYRDDVLYRMGESYVKLQEPLKAIEKYRMIEKQFPQSVYLAESRMKIGLVLYNTGKHEESIIEFKNLVADFPASQVAREAINNVRSVYVDIGDVVSYANWLEKLSFIDVSTSSLDSTSYESAELQYLKGDYSKAYDGFKLYLNTYPQGIFALSANYYYALAATQIDSISQAIEAFELVNTYHNNAYTLSTLKQLALLYQSKFNYKKALEQYATLDVISETVEEQLFAKQGLMDCYFELNDYQSAIEQAELVLNSGRIGESHTIELNTFIARAAFLNLDRALASEKYKYIEGVSQGNLKAEAMYHLAYLEFYDGNYDAAMEIIFEQSRLLPLYKKWLGKSFIVLAKAYIEMGDLFQANHTLEQLIINIEDEEIVREAKSIKAKLLAEEEGAEIMDLGLDTLQFLDSIPDDTSKYIKE